MPPFACHSRRESALLLPPEPTFPTQRPSTKESPVDPSALPKTSAISRQLSPDKLERMTSRVKKTISITLFSLGACAGLAGCAIYPMAIFTVGANDSWQEVCGITIVCLSLFPLCVLALRFPLFSGCSMLLVPCFYLYASAAQLSFMIHVRHFPQPAVTWRQMIETLNLVWPYIALGVFAITTSRLRWLTILNWPRLKREAP
jgi:hypothetical protein